MKIKSLQLLIITSCICIPATIIASRFQPFSESKFFNIAIAFYFSGLTYFILLLCYNSLKSTDKNAFTRTGLGMIFVKLIFSATIVILYKLIAEPKTLFFIVPFFINYFIFTFIEIYILNQLIKENS